MKYPTDVDITFRLISFKKIFYAEFNSSILAKINGKMDSSDSDDMLLLIYEVHTVSRVVKVINSCQVVVGSGYLINETHIATAASLFRNNLGTLRVKVQLSLNQSLRTIIPSKIVTKTDNLVLARVSLVTIKSLLIDFSLNYEF